MIAPSARSLARIVALACVLAGAAPLTAEPSRAQARVDAARTAYDVAAHGFTSTEPGLVHQWSLTWFEAQRALPLKGKALAAAAQAHLERMIALQRAVDAAVAAGTLRESDRVFVAYYRAEAEAIVERKGAR